MLLKQLYKPDQKICKTNFFFRFISKLIISIFLINKIKRFSNSFQQILKTYLEIKFRNKSYYFKDGHERLYWRYKTQFFEEKELCNWIDTFKKKDIFCDIGSNVGMFSIYAAKKNVLTYSIEPHPSNLDYLYWNIYLNNLMKKIIVFPLALNKNSKLTNFMIRDLTPGVAKNYLEENIKNSKKINFKFLSFSFDEIIKNYNLKYPTKIKLDVDGNEFEILKGMNLCLNYVDEIYIEMMQDKKNYLNNKKIINFLKKRNFFINEKYKENYLFKKKYKYR